MGLNNVLRSSRYTETVTVKRSASSSYVNGTLVPGLTTATVTVASIQPASGDELGRSEEGQRVGEFYKIYINLEVKPASETEQRKADIVVWRGQEYEVELVDRWYLSSNYYKAFIRRKGQS